MAWENLKRRSLAEADLVRHVPLQAPNSLNGTIDRYMPTTLSRGLIMQKTLKNLDFGIIAIGDEVLSGHRHDRHFAGIGELIRQRGFKVAWLRILSDDPAYLINEFRHTFAEKRPVFDSVEFA